MARWIEFVRDHTDRPHKRQMIDYTAGSTVFLPDPVADRIIATGAAKETEKPKGLKTNKTGKTIPDVDWNG